MKRPVSLTIVGTAWFLMALSGAISDAIQGHGFEIPGTYFINLLVGVGLLKGWRLCRWYALFVFGSALLFAMPMAIFNSDKVIFQFPAVLIDDRPHAIVPLFLVVLAMIGYVAISAWGGWILMRRDVRAWFHGTTNALTTVPI